MNNKGMEIAINQIVILIIGIVILGMGFTLVSKIMNAGDNLLEGIDDRTEQQLEKSLSGDHVVEIPLSTKKMMANEMKMFYIGIYNDPLVTGNTFNGKFEVIISFNKAINSRGLPINNLNKEEITKKTLLLIDSGTIADGANGINYEIKVPDDDFGIVSLGFNPKLMKLGRGQYFFNVCVCKDNCNPQINSCDASTVNSLNNLYGFSTFSAIIQ